MVIFMASKAAVIGSMFLVAILATVMMIIIVVVSLVVAQATMSTGAVPHNRAVN